MLKVAVIGMGTVSPIHIHSIKNSKYAELVATCDIRNANKSKVLDANFYTDYKEMLEKEDLDLVHIALPHYLHAEVSKYALGKGVHVFCEKPVDVGYKESKDLNDFHKSLNNETKLGICFQNRYNKTVVKLKEILKDEIDDIFAVKGMVPWYRPEEYYDQAPWRGKIKYAGAGVIINQAIHTLDLCHFLTGRNWEKLKAKIFNLMDYGIEVEDTAAANIHYEDGIRGLFIATNAYSINDSVEIQVVTKNDKYTIKENKLFNRKHELLAEDEKSEATKDYYGAGHEILINKFYKAIIDDTDDYADLDSAMETMEIIDAIKLSSKKDKFIERKDIIND